MEEDISQAGPPGYVKRANTVPWYLNDAILGTLLGGGIGGATGAGTGFLTTRNRENRRRNTLAGAIAGAGLGGLLGHGYGRRNAAVFDTPINILGIQHNHPRISEFLGHYADHYRKDFSPESFDAALRTPVALDPAGRKPISNIIRGYLGYPVVAGKEDVVRHALSAGASNIDHAHGVALVRDPSWFAFAGDVRPRERRELNSLAAAWIPYDYRPDPGPSLRRRESRRGIGRAYRRLDRVADSFEYRFPRDERTPQTRRMALDLFGISTAPDSYRAMLRESADNLWRSNTHRTTSPFYSPEDILKWRELRAFMDGVQRHTPQDPDVQEANNYVDLLRRLFSAYRTSSKRERSSLPGSAASLTRDFPWYLLNMSDH